MFAYFTNLTWPKLAKITWILIGVFIALTFSFCLFKYYTYSYNSADLGIFNQVFFNSSNGHLFAFTIHPTSYLGDHFELIIFFLLPFYSFFKSPLTLLFIQACFVGLSAIPIFLIAKKHLPPLLSLFIIVLYLFNPGTLNLTLFEFHILPLAIFLILWAFYFYDQNKFWPFVAFCGLSLLVREDVALIIFMFGVVAALDRKKITWVLTPLVMAAAYFAVALKIISYFSTSDNYKFLIYYGWLGNSLGQIFINFFLKFPEVIKHIFLNYSHLELIVGLFLIMLFLPLYRPKYLLLAAPSLLEFILGWKSGALVLQTHYVSLFMPILIIAAIFSLKNLQLNKKIIQLNSDHKEIIPTVLIVGLLYISLQLGPWSSFVTIPVSVDYQQAALKNQFSQLIPQNASLLTGFGLLPNFSSRSRLYLLHYAFLNKQQFDTGSYPLPSDLQYVFLDWDDFLFLDLGYAQSPKYSTAYYQGDDRLRELLASYTLIKADQNLALWQLKKSETKFSLYEIINQKSLAIQNKKSQPLGSPIEFLGYDKNQGSVSLYFKCLQLMDKNYFIKLNNRYYSLGYGLYPTSAWQVGQVVKINFYNLPNITSFQVAKPYGRLIYNGLNSFVLDLNKIEILGDANLD